MDKNNPIVFKSFNFAMRIVRLYRHLVDKHKEYTLSRELLQAGTHIGKHVKEAVSGESTDNFIYQMGMALRKASETEYWLQLVHFAEYIDERELASIDADRVEIAKMLTSIIKTKKQNG